MLSRLYYLHKTFSKSYKNIEVLLYFFIIDLHYFIYMLQHFSLKSYINVSNFLNLYSFSKFLCMYTCFFVLIRYF